MREGGGGGGGGGWGGAPANRKSQSDGVEYIYIYMYSSMKRIAYGMCHMLVVNILCVSVLSYFVWYQL